MEKQSIPLQSQRQGKAEVQELQRETSATDIEENAENAERSTVNGERVMPRSDLERQNVLSTAFIKQILDGLRAEQVSNHVARLSHEWTQRATDRVRAPARFAGSFQGARQRGDSTVQEFDDIQDNNVRRPFPKRIATADTTFTRQKPFITEM
jgi:hypothetical protein